MTAEQFAKKYKLQNRQWVHKGYHGTLFFHAAVAHVGLDELQKYYGDHYELIVDYFCGENGTWHWHYPDMVRIRDSFIAKVNKNPKVLTKLVEDWEKRLIAYDRIADKIKSINLSKLNNKRLIDLYLKEEQIYISEFSVSISIQDAFSMTAEEFLLPSLEKFLASKGLAAKTLELMEILTTPSKPSFASLEYIDRLKVRIKIKDINKLAVKDKKLLANHARKYEWLNNNYAVTHKLGANYFLDLLQHLSKQEAAKKLIKESAKIKEKLKRKEELLRKLKPNKEIRILLEITDVFTYMQDKRKKYSLMACGLEQSFLQEFAKRMHIGKQQAKWLHFKEISGLISGKAKVNKKELDERSKYCVSVATINNKFEVIGGKAAESVIDKYLKSEPKSVNEIKGITASQGRAAGKVKVLMQAMDLIKMSKGDILVSSMTRPEMVPAMKKAAAIVTDEGGITSHAAILSRELGIPCIIGTKIATKVLKDGDMVEVDANKGIVRKIK